MYNEETGDLKAIDWEYAAKYQFRREFRLYELVCRKDSTSATFLERPACRYVLAFYV